MTHPHRRRGAPDRRRGRRPLPRRRRRDAAGRSPRGVPRERGGSARLPARPLCPRPRAVHDRRGGGAVRAGRRGRACAARGRGPARARRTPARRHRARVVRSRCSASPAARFARAPAPPGRARGTRGAGAVPPGVAGARPPRDAARGARSAPGTLAAGVAVGIRRSAAPRAELPGRAARPALRIRRSRLGRRRARTGRDLLPRGRSCTRPPRCAAAARGRGARGDPRCAGPRRALLVRPARRDRPRSRDGAARPVGSRLGRRGVERRLDAASCEPPVRDAAARTAAAAVLPFPGQRDHGDAGTLVGDGAALRRASPIHVRSPSCSSNARGS